MSLRRARRRTASPTPAGRDLGRGRDAGLTILDEPFPEEGLGSPDQAEIPAWQRELAEEFARAGDTLIHTIGRQARFVGGEARADVALTLAATLGVPQPAVVASEAEVRTPHLNVAAQRDADTGELTGRWTWRITDELGYDAVGGVAATHAAAVEAGWRVYGDLHEVGEA